MIWIIILTSVIAYTIYNELYILKLSNLKKLLSMTEEEKLLFLKNKGFTRQFSGSDLNDDYTLIRNRIISETVHFSHDLINIIENNLAVEKLNLTTDTLREKITPREVPYLSYVTNKRKSNILLNQISNSGFSIRTNTNLKKEGFEWLSEEINKKYSHLSKIEQNVDIYSNNQFGIIHLKPPFLQEFIIYPKSRK